MATPEPTFSVPMGSEFAVALTAARAASERVEVSNMDDWYREAVRLADDLARSQPGLHTAIAVEHVSRLREHHDSTRALARCEEYLDTYGDDVQLLLRRTETKMSLGDFSAAGADLARVRRLAAGQPLSQEDDALLLRLEEIAAGRAVESGAGNGHQDTMRDRLARAEELRLVGRYEQALDELDSVLAEPHDPALRFFLLEAKVRLLRILRADEEADGLLPDLRATAEKSTQPAENGAQARRLEANGFLSADVVSDNLVQRARGLVLRGQLAEAEELLRDAHDPDRDDRYVAEWNLAMAELFMAISRWVDETTSVEGAETAARLAAVHAKEAVAYATNEPAVAVRISALRLLGHAYSRLPGNMDLAVRMWANAHRAEEEVADLQPSDHYRLPMLQAARTEFDELVEWARDQGEDGAPEDVLVATAVEAARGSAILRHILPDQRTRWLPDPGDVPGARRWLRRAVRGLPRSQAIWMLHATANNVYHVFVQRTWRGPLVRVQAVPVKRRKLIVAIQELVGSWTDGRARTLVERVDAREVFERRLDVVAGLLGIRDLPELSEQVRRIAVIAGGELSEIPFALLPCPGAENDLIGRRFALSDLPCLAARTPLNKRSRRQRGTRRSHMLVLQGPQWSLWSISPATELRGRKSFDVEESTPARLDTELRTHRYRVVRIDSHGTFHSSASESVLLLAPDETEQGKLHADQLRRMELGATGTLIVGACESGMFTYIGRNERIGFVRAGLTGGASAVVAARWEAEDTFAVRLLDRFERYLRRHPRDTALFMAQRDAEAEGVPPQPVGHLDAVRSHQLPDPPWACVTPPVTETRAGPGIRPSVSTSVKTSRGKYRRCVMVTTVALPRRIATLFVLAMMSGLLGAPSPARAVAGADETTGQPPPELRPVRITVLVDQSGSLSEEDIASERNAARLIVQGEPSDQSTVSVVGFASADAPGQRAVDVVCPPTTLDTPQKRDGMARCVGKLERRGRGTGDGTDHVNALRTALTHLSSPGGEHQPKIVFLLTDGKLDVGKSPEYGNTPEARNRAAREQLPVLLDELRQTGISVWPLGFGKVDREQLAGFASGGAQERCGDRTPAPKATVVARSADLMRAVSEASQAARCVNVTEPVSGWLPEGGSVDLSVDIPAIASEGSIITYKGDPRVTVSYHDPEGAVAPANGRRGISRFSRTGQGFEAEALRIVNPVPGRWTVRLSAPPGVPAREVSAVASFQGAVRAEIGVAPTAPRPGEPVEVTMQVRGSRGPITSPEDLRGLAFTTGLNGDGFKPVAPVGLDDQDGDGQYQTSLTVPGGATGRLEFVGSVSGVGVSGDRRTYPTQISGMAVQGSFSLEGEGSDVVVGSELRGTADITNSSGQPRTVRLEVVDPSDGAVISVSRATLELPPAGNDVLEFTVRFDEDTRLGPNQARLRLVDTLDGALVGELLFARNVVPVPTWWHTNWWWVVSLMAIAAVVLARLVWLGIRRVRRAGENRDVRGTWVQLRRDGYEVSRLTASQRGREFSFVVCADQEDEYRLSPSGDGDRYRLRRDATGPVLLRSSPTPVALPLDLGDGVELVVHDRAPGFAVNGRADRVSVGGQPAEPDFDAYGSN